MLSYTTFNAYHMIEEKKDNYALASFAEATICRSKLPRTAASKQQPELAENSFKFMVYLASRTPSPTGNWMGGPVTQVTFG